MNPSRNLLVASLSLSMGCFHVFPPPPVPGRIEPLPVDTPIPSGQGRLYIDVADGPTNVRVVHPVTVEETLNDEVFESTELETVMACRTPCVLDLPLGRQLVAFPLHRSYAEEVVNVPISTTPSLYRRALGSRWRRGAGFALGILGVAFGGTSFVTGAALLPVGLATDHSGLTTAGAITLSAGSVLTALGIWTLAKNPTYVQPGAGALYELGP